MAWVRIHDGAMTHPKVVGLSDKAFRLWVWGLSYAQQHLTDGLLPTAAMPARLTRAIADLERHGLWEAHAVGYKVHDYLEWNDSRDLVVKKRTEAKERMANARQRSSRELLRRVGLDQESLDQLEAEGESEGKPSVSSALERNFEAFWANYPRKIGKDAARRAWRCRKPDDVLTARMLNALAWQVQQPDWRKDGGQFIPHPATWLNQGRWLDEVGVAGEPATRRRANLCPHDPPCERLSECAARIVNERHAKTASA